MFSFYIKLLWQHIMSDILQKLNLQWNSLNMKIQDDITFFRPTLPCYFFGTLSYPSITPFMKFTPFSTYNSKSYPPRSYEINVKWPRIWFATKQYILRAKNLFKFCHFFLVPSRYINTSLGVQMSIYLTPSFGNDCFKKKM